MGGERDQKQTNAKILTHDTSPDNPPIQELAASHDGQLLLSRRCNLKLALLSVAIVVGPIIALFCYPRIVCFASTRETTLNWIQGLRKEMSNSYYLNPITSHFEDFTIWDKFMLGCRCKELILVELAVDFLAKNPVENYYHSREYVRQTTTRIGILNGTCESFAEALDYASKTPNDLYEQCLKNRSTVFSIFNEYKLPERLIGKEKKPNSGVFDIPCLDSTDIYAAILFLGESARVGALENVQAQLARKAKQLETEQARKAKQQEVERASEAEVQKNIQHLFSEKRSVLCASSQVSDALNSFKFAVVGKYFSGKSTTMQWLAKVAGLDSSIVNSFVHLNAATGGGGSFTRDFAPVKFSKYVTIADTMGLNGLDTCYVSDIRKILFGRNKPYQQMEYIGCSGKKTNVYLPSSETSQFLSGLLFILRYPSSSRERDKITIFIKELRKKYEQDLTRRIAFLVTHLPTQFDPHIISTLADQIQVSQLDIFPLINIGTPANVTLTRQSLYRPLKRMMEKACLFHQNDATSGQDPDYNPGLFSWFF